ncbi:MAG: hypothetical protein RLZZ383_1792 [Pseudomonadota bacterium]
MIPLHEIPPGSAADVLLHIAVATPVVALLLAFTASVPWTHDDILTTRRVWVATGQVLANRVRRALPSLATAPLRAVAAMGALLSLSQAR